MKTVCVPDEGWPELSDPSHYRIPSYYSDDVQSVLVPAGLEKDVVDKIAERNGYPTSEAIIAIFDALKRKGFLHKSVEYKSPCHPS